MTLKLFTNYLFDSLFWVYGEKPIYFTCYNSDLQDRISEVPVEPWESRDFDSVIAKGCKELNVSIDPSMCEEFKKNAYGNIGMLQEFLKTFCRLCGIRETQSSLVKLTDTDKLSETIARKLEDQRGELLQTLQGIASKSRVDSDQSLILPYYLVKVILTTPVSELISGIPRKQLLDKLRETHHREAKDTVRMSDLANLLNRLPNYQMDTNTPFLHYDRNQERLNIVNSRHFFVLANTDRDGLLEEIPVPPLIS